MQYLGFVMHLCQSLLFTHRWEVPSHVALRAIYKHGEATDPRFIKLEPVFKCSMLRRGGLQRYAAKFSPCFSLELSFNQVYCNQLMDLLNLKVETHFCLLQINKASYR